VPFYRFVTSELYKNFFRLPEPLFAGAKITRNHGEFLHFEYFLSSAKWCEIISKAVRAFGAFADLEKSVKRHYASRFRRMFARNEQTSRAGRGANFRAFRGTDKAAKAGEAFCLFFFQKEKEEIALKAAGFRLLHWVLRKFRFRAPAGFRRKRFGNCSCTAGAVFPE